MDAVTQDHQPQVGRYHDGVMQLNAIVPMPIYWSVREFLVKNKRTGLGDTLDSLLIELVHGRLPDNYHYLPAYSWSEDIKRRSANIQFNVDTYLTLHQFRLLNRCKDMSETMTMLYYCGTTGQLPKGYKFLDTKAAS